MLAGLHSVLSLASERLVPPMHRRDVMTYLLNYYVLVLGWYFCLLFFATCLEIIFVYVVNRIFDHFQNYMLFFKTYYMCLSDEFILIYDFWEFGLWLTMLLQRSRLAASQILWSGNWTKLVCTQNKLVCTSLGSAWKPRINRISPFFGHNCTTQHLERTAHQSPNSPKPSMKQHWRHK